MDKIYVIIERGGTNGVLNKAYFTFDLAYEAVVDIVNHENTKYKKTQEFLYDTHLPGQMELVNEREITNDGVLVANLYDYSIHIFIKELSV